MKVAENFTILVEAVDHGDVVQMSSSTTIIVHVQDGNNHLPVISGQTVGEPRLTSKQTLGPLLTPTTTLNMVVSLHTRNTVPLQDHGHRMNNLT